jgi:peroxiredoxin
LPGILISKTSQPLFFYELSRTGIVLKPSKSNTQMEFALIEPEVMSNMMTNRGVSLSEASDSSPVMLIFLRHFGCTFCREALADISDLREDIERLGVRIIFVHMTDNETAEPFFHRFGLDGAEHISDPMCQYYAAFGLVKGSYRQLYGLRSWIRGFQSIVVEGNGYGAELGDGFQMPGIFVVHKRDVRGGFIHKHSSDRPDYVALTKSCLP